MKTIDITEVTSEQIDRCHRIIDEQTMEVFYLVQSESDDLVEYKVQYQTLPTKHYTCTCPAGLAGFAHVRHASGVCKHVRWALAAAQEYKAELRARAQRDAARAAVAPEHVLIINGKPATAEELDRVMNAKPTPVKSARAIQSKPFSLLR